jgi:hypothetical protein
MLPERRGMKDARRGRRRGRRIEGGSRIEGASRRLRQSVVLLP